MKRLGLMGACLLLASLLLASTVFAQVAPPGPSSGPNSSIVGQIQTATGGVIKGGTLTFTLSQPAIAASTASIVSQTSSCYTSTQGNVVGLPDPTVAPTVSTNVISGTLPAGTYYVEVFYLNASLSVSAPSPERQIVLSSTGTLIVNALTLQPPSAIGYGVAIGSSSGSETIQGTVTGWGQYQQTSALVTGPALQATNNSTCNVWFSDALIPTGTNYSVNLVNANGSQIAGFPQTWCTYGGGNGTINVSQGAPTGNCNVNGVFYPTPIYANPPAPSQSINSNLGVNGVVTSVGVSSGVVNTIYYPATCGGSLPPSWCSGSDLGAWTNAAFAACAGSGGCLVAWPYGTFTVTTPVVLPSLADSLIGMGISGTILNYSASGCPVTSQPTTFSVAHAGVISDFQVVGTSAGRCALHITDVTGQQVVRVEASGFTNGTGFWVDDQNAAGFGPAWTERTAFWDAWSNNNLKGWQFTVNGGSLSFKASDCHSCHANTVGAQTVWSVEGGQQLTTRSFKSAGICLGPAGRSSRLPPLGRRSIKGHSISRWKRRASRQP